MCQKINFASFFFKKKNCKESIIINYSPLRINQAIKNKKKYTSKHISNTNIK